MQEPTEATPKANGKLRRIYAIASGTLTVLVFAYFLLLNFPQTLLAKSVSYEKFTVYSSEPIEPGIEKVLDSAEARLRRSPIYDETVARRIYLTKSHGMYMLLSHKAYMSFANSVPFINNVIINKSDIAADRVFVSREKNNSRSLSGVIAHEVAHLLIRQRYGTIQASLMPTWKNEGYCEYVAGDSTITLDEGIRMWRENPADDTGYRYTKYHLMIKHLLEKENMTVDELFTSDLNENDVAARTLSNL
jgi:hypothetical protein